MTDEILAACKESLAQHIEELISLGAYKPAVEIELTHFIKRELSKEAE